MTAETTAATATADPSAATATTTAETPATDATTPEGSQVTPPADTTTTAAQVKGGDKPAETAAPEKYDFTLADGMAVDEGLLAAAEPILRKLNVTQEGAQELAAVLAKHMKSLEAGGNEAFDKAYSDRKEAEVKTQSEEWRATTVAAKDLGEAVRSRVIEAVGQVATPEAKEAFDTLGWGNHPEMVRLINKLIDYVPPEKGERVAGSGSGSSTLLDRLYKPSA